MVQQNPAGIFLVISYLALLKLFATWALRSRLLLRQSVAAASPGYLKLR